MVPLWVHNLTYYLCVLNATKSIVRFASYYANLFANTRDV